MSSLNIRLLGPPVVKVDGHPIKVDTRKAIALLAYLAVTGQEHGRDTLAALLWPESDQSRARAALRRTLSTLNRALGEGWLRAGRATVDLSQADGFALDVLKFQDLLRRVERHDHDGPDGCQRCLGWLEEAAALHHDDFMAGFTLRDSPAFDEWQLFQAESYRRGHTRALEQLTRARAAQGRLDEAIESAGQLIALDSLNETAHRNLMELYALRGDRSAALQQYREAVRVLQEELGVAPLEETTELYERIREDEFAGAAQSRDLLPVVPVSAEPPGAASLRGRLPLVGREADLESLWTQYQRVAKDGRFVLVEGEAGVGKTRLTEEFAALLAERGVRIAAARCYEEEADLAYGALTDALRSVFESHDEAWWHELPEGTLAEAARLLPDLAPNLPDGPPLPPLDSPGAQSRFFEALRRIFQAMDSPNGPAVFLIDNLHWADEATRELFSYLVRRLHGSRIFLLATWRNGNALDGPDLRSWTGQVGQAGTGTQLQLSRLNREQVADLIRLLEESGAELPAKVSERLFSHTEGLPLFIAEYLAALENGRVNGVEEDWGIPGGVRALLESQLNKVGEAESQLLGAAAVIGRSFEFDVLRQASGRGEEETVGGLESLLAAGLIAEVGEAAGPRGPVYDFKHEQLRAVVLEGLTQARRRLLHRRVAEALIRSAGRTRVDSVAGRLAHHYAMAGDQAEAADFYVRAGDHARGLFANREALAYYMEALTHGHEDLAGLHEAIGDLQTLEGDYGQALASYQAAAAYLDAPETSRLERKLGGVYHRRGDWDQAGSHFEAALEVLGEKGPVHARAQILGEWSLTRHQAGEPRQAQSLARKALKLAADSEDPEALAQIHNILGILARGRGDPEEAEKQLRASLTFAEALGDPSVRAAALNNMALALGDSGKHGQAFEYAQQALDLSRSHGDRHREAALLSNMADLLHADGRTEEAMPLLKQAAGIFTEIGTDERDYEPEIWKLIEW